MRPRQMAQVSAPGTSLLLSESAESPSSSPSGEDADESFKASRELGKDEWTQDTGRGQPERSDRNKQNRGIQVKMQREICSRIAKQRLWQGKRSLKHWKKHDSWLKFKLGQHGNFICHDTQTKLVRNIELDIYSFCTYVSLMSFQ